MKPINPKPKYQIGDEVWMIVDKKAIKQKIYGVLKLQENKVIITKYFLYLEYEVKKYDWKIECDLFASKEDLVASL